MNGNKLQIGYFILNHIPYKGYTHFSNFDREDVIYKKLIEESGLNKLYDDDKLSHSRKKIELIDKRIELSFAFLDKNFSDEYGRKGIIYGCYMSFLLEDFNFYMLADIDKFVQQYFEKATNERNKVVKKGRFDDNNSRTIEENNKWLLNSIFEVLQNSADENHSEEICSEEVYRIISDKGFNKYLEKTVDTLLTSKLKQSKVCGLFKVRLKDK